MTKKTDDLLNEINKKLDLMKLEWQKDMEPLKNKKYDVKYDMKNWVFKGPSPKDNQLTDLKDS